MNRKSTHRVLVAGATGHLGRNIVRELQNQNYGVRIIIRNPNEIKQVNFEPCEQVVAELTDPRTLVGCCEGIDTVITTVGITRQKEVFTYMDVDYQANKNLLDEAKKSGVRKIIYISVFNGQKFTKLKICQAKEKFVKEVVGSGLEYCILRPNGYFSDMAEFYQMAKKGRAYTIGDGKTRINPIDLADLATVCVEAVTGKDTTIEVGGPEVLTHDQIVYKAFKVLDKQPKITHIPTWLVKIFLGLLRKFTNQKTYGPIEFLLTVLTTDMVAPKHGSRTLEEYFTSLQRE